MRTSITSTVREGESSTFSNGQNRPEGESRASVMKLLLDKHVDPKVEDTTTLGDVVRRVLFTSATLLFASTVYGQSITWTASSPPLTPAAAAEVLRTNGSVNNVTGFRVWPDEPTVVLVFSFPGQGPFGLFPQPRVRFAYAHRSRLFVHRLPAPHRPLRFMRRR